MKSRNRKKEQRMFDRFGRLVHTMLRCVRVQRPCFGRREASSWPEENKQKYLKNERDLHYVDRWPGICSSIQSETVHIVGSLGGNLFCFKKRFSPSAVLDSALCCAILSELHAIPTSGGMHTHTARTLAGKRQVSAKDRHT